MDKLLLRMWFGIAMLALAQLITPATFLARLLPRLPGSQLEAVLSASMVAGYLAFVFLIGRWDFFGYPLRWALPAGFVLVLAASWESFRSLPFAPATFGGAWLENGIRVALVLLFLWLVGKALRGYSPPAAALEMSFPLRQGTYYVAHGGGDASINYHFPHPTQRFALDIVKLNALGLRASGLYPRALHRYAVFGDDVHSPVAGTVLRAVDGLPDLVPPAADAERRAGNHVVIRPHGRNCYVLLAHLQEGSVRVREGEQVAVGERIGRVGNSGNTTEPHLHIHCATLDNDDYVDGGEGIAIRFDGRYLKRNGLVRCAGTAAGAGPGDAERPRRRGRDEAG